MLNIARQNYGPQGASVTMLIDEEPMHMPPDSQLQIEAPGPLPESVVGLLDKSHITVHTCLESHPCGDPSIFRADIDVSICGEISPLRTLNYPIHEFESDIVVIDYRVRGLIKNFDLDNYLFGTGAADLEPAEVEAVRERLEVEMDEIFYGCNTPDA